MEFSTIDDLFKLMPEPCFKDPCEIFLFVQELLPRVKSIQVGPELGLPLSHELSLFLQFRNLAFKLSELLLL